MKISLKEAIEQYGDCEVDLSELEPLLLSHNHHAPVLVRGRSYYYMKDTGELGTNIWKNDANDRFLYDTNNIDFDIAHGAPDLSFRVAQIKFITAMQRFAGRNGWRPDWKNKDEPKWYVGYHMQFDLMDVLFTNLFCIGNTVYFQSEQDAKQFADENRDALLEYYFMLTIRKPAQDDPMYKQAEPLHAISREDKPANE